MRLFILLAAAAVAVLNAADAPTPPPPKPPANKIELDKFEDGTLITFWFKHQANPTQKELAGFKDEPVFINFFNTPSEDDYSEHTKFGPKLLAHFRVSGDESYAVQSATWKAAAEGEKPWVDAVQPSGSYGSDYIAISLPTNMKSGNTDAFPEGDPYWRVDVYKHDKYRMSVFFQGYWSQVREFHKNLDAVKSIYIYSYFIDEKSVQIFVKTPNQIRVPSDVTNVTRRNTLPVLSWYKADRQMSSKDKDFYIYKHIEFSNFSKGANIEMSVVLPATVHWNFAAALDFWKVGAAEPFFRIVHVYSDDIWSYKPHVEQWLSNKPRDQVTWRGRGMDKDTRESNGGVLCSLHKKPYGDFQHFLLTRGEDRVRGQSTMAVLKLRTFFDHHTDVIKGSGTECEIEVAATYLNEPFLIMGGLQGAMILHLETDADVDFIYNIDKFDGEAP